MTGYAGLGMLLAVASVGAAGMTALMGAAAGGGWCEVGGGGMVRGGRLRWFPAVVVPVIAVCGAAVGDGGDGGAATFGDRALATARGGAAAAGVADGERGGVPMR
ncbi:MAG: hypothetical protein U0232_17760 [Thermomicrobiales bacterium]